MRFIALDVHSDFCEVAIKDASGLRLAGRVKSSIQELELFAGSLCPDLCTSSSLDLSSGRAPRLGDRPHHAGRVVVGNCAAASMDMEDSAPLPPRRPDAVTYCQRS